MRLQRKHINVGNHKQHSKDRPMCTIISGPFSSSSCSNTPLPPGLRGSSRGSISTWASIGNIQRTELCDRLFCGPFSSSSCSNIPFPAGLSRGKHLFTFKQVCWAVIMLLSIRNLIFPQVSIICANVLRNSCITGKNLRLFFQFNNSFNFVLGMKPELTYETGKQLLFFFNLI